VEGFAIEIPTSSVFTCSASPKFRPVTARRKPCTLGEAGFLHRSNWVVRCFMGFEFENELPLWPRRMLSKFPLAFRCQMSYTVVNIIHKRRR
jgi:hypothetical protein